MFNGERFNFKILSVLRLEFPVSERYSPPRHYHALIFRAHGKATVVKGETEIRLNKNDVTFVPSGCEYVISSSTDEDVIIVHFEASFKKIPPVSNMHATNPDAFITLFGKLFDTWQNQPCGFVYRIDSLFLSILEQIERQSLESNVKSAKYCVQHAVEAMHSGFSNPELSVESLSKDLGYCTSYFRRIFLEEMGVTPKEYLVNLRINHAIALLESQYYSVEKVAELSGYTSAKYFSTSFKRVTGKSPSCYLSHKRK
ncbi:MAG: helix-turn-helix domain-containing protein [Clostridia bacterium]|nr:helix-turn-helix domain-containing protein [Clostridia bacterium]